MPLTSSSPSQDSLLSSSSSHHPLEPADLPLSPSTNPGLTSKPNLLTLTRLPRELFLHILSSLSPNDLIRLGKAFPDGSPRQKLCDDPVLWETLFTQHFPHAVRLVAAETNPDWKKAFLTLRMLYRYSPEDLIHRGNIFPDHSLEQRLYNNIVWKTLFTRHFPHAVWSVAAQKDPDWKAAFITTSETEYRGLNPRAKRLFYFMKEGDLAALKREGLSHADLHISDSCHQPLCCWAGAKKKQDLLDYCYQLEFSTYVSSTGALDLTKRDDNGRTILSWAAAYGQPADFIFDLIQQGADCHARDVYGNTVLFIAAQNGHLSVVSVLLEKGADPHNSARTDNGATPLHIAAENGHLDVVNTLLEKGANPNSARTNDGATPLFFAAQYGHLDVVKALLKKGANPHSALTNGATPLFIAAQNGHLGVINVLLAKGADLNSARTDGTTPLFFAAHNDHLDVVKALLEKGANPNSARTDNGATPLFFAAQNGHAQIVDSLMIKQADPRLALTLPREDLIEFARNINPGVLHNMQLFINAQIRAGATESAITITPWQIACIMNQKAVLECFQRHCPALSRQSENCASSSASSSTGSLTFFSLSLNDDDQRFLDLCFRERMVSPVPVLESGCSTSSPRYSS